jgi:hypothetical protein
MRKPSLRFTVSRSGALLFLLSAVIGPATSALGYDANADFVANSPNPNGVWRYGYTTTLGGAFIPFNEYVSNAAGYGWRTNIASSAPSFSHADIAINGMLPGETALHGGPNGEVAVLRFIVPSAGPYDILATWRGPGDISNTDLYLLRNSNTVSPLGSTSSTTISGSFQWSGLLLLAGDTIDLALGIGGDGFNFDSTPVNLQINVPEPASAMLLALGLISCFMRPCRKGNTSS